MPMTAKLVHRAEIFRPFTELDDKRRRRLVYPEESTATEDCYLEEGPSAASQEMFGRGVAMQGVVYFRDGADVRPATGGDGKPDRLVITDLVDQKPLGSWLVVGSRRRARRLLVVAVTKGE